MCGDCSVHVLLNSNADLADFNVTISGVSEGTAGEELQLTCTVRVGNHQSVSPSVQWSCGSVRGSGVTESEIVINELFIINNINVTIKAVYTPAPGEDPGKLGLNQFTEGSLLILNCSVDGNSADLSYSWSVSGNPSTPEDCGVKCDISTSSTSIQTLGKPALNPYHAGVYTCTVAQINKPENRNSMDIPITVVGETNVNQYCH